MLASKCQNESAHCELLREIIYSHSDNDSDPEKEEILVRILLQKSRKEEIVLL